MTELGRSEVSEYRKDEQSNRDDFQDVPRRRNTLYAGPDGVPSIQLLGCLRTDGMVVVEPDVIGVRFVAMCRVVGAIIWLAISLLWSRTPPSHIMLPTGIAVAILSQVGLVNPPRQPRSDGPPRNLGHRWGE